MSSWVYQFGNPDHDQVQAAKIAPRAPATLIYPSLARFQADVAAGRVDRRVTVVAYDPEAWTRTPRSERVNPASAMRSFAALARREGYRVMLTPGRDLVSIAAGRCHAERGERLEHAYLRCGIPTTAAKAGDMFAVQAQADEFSPHRYRRLVRRAAAQARAANPSIVVLAGVSTKPPTGTATAATLEAAARIARREADGVWVNVFSDHAAQRRVGCSFFGWLRRHPY